MSAQPSVTPGANSLHENSFHEADCHADSGSASQQLVRPAYPSDMRLPHPSATDDKDRRSTSPAENEKDSRITAFRRLPLVRTLTNRLLPLTSIRDLNPAFSYRDIMVLSREITSQMDPASHYFLGLGRSPFPLTTALNLMHPGCATIIPISYNRYRWTRHLPRPIRFSNYTKIDLVPYSRGEVRYFDYKKDSYVHEDHPELPNLLSDHLDRFLPSEKEISGRSLVIMDFSEYGTTVASFFKDLSWYLEQKRRQIPVKCLFIQSGPDYTNHFWGKEGWQRDRLRDIAGHVPPLKVVGLHAMGLTELSRALSYEEYKPFSPYPHFVLNGEDPDSSARLRVKRAYLRFARAMANEFLRNPANCAT